MSLLVLKLKGKIIKNSMKNIKSMQKKIVSKKRFRKKDNHPQHLFSSE